MKRALIGFVLMLWFLTPLAFAAPNLKISPPAKTITTDQAITLKLELEWLPSEGPYEINSLEPKVENLTIEDQNQSQETGSTVRQTITYTFRPIKKGTALIYPFEISCRKSEKEPWTPILVPEQKIEIRSAFPLKAILLNLGILVFFVASGVAGFRLWQSKKNRELEAALPPVDPKQRIYAKAEEAIATFVSPTAKEKITHWANELRTVIAAYYDIPPQRSTEAEILSLLKTRDLPSGEFNEIARLFTQLTELQFSRQDIPPADLEQIQKTLLQYVKGKIIIGELRA